MLNKVKGMFSGNGASSASESTIISPAAKINGTVEVDGNLDVWGKIAPGELARPNDLTVKASGVVVVNEGASVLGAVQGKSILLRGVDLELSQMFYEQHMELDHARSGSIAPRAYDNLSSTSIPENSTVEVSLGSHVGGNIEGHAVTIKGTVQGKIIGHNVTVHGSVFGDVKATGILRLSAKAVIRGSVEAGLIEVALGAKIEGTMLLGVTNEVNSESSSPTRANIRNVSSSAEITAEA